MRNNFSFLTLLGKQKYVTQNINESSTKSVFVLRKMIYSHPNSIASSNRINFETRKVTSKKNKSAANSQDCWVKSNIIFLCPLNSIN